MDSPLLPRCPSSDSRRFQAPYYVDGRLVEPPRQKIRDFVGGLQQHLLYLDSKGYRPSRTSSDFVEHMYRELDGPADNLASNLTNRLMIHVSLMQLYIEPYPVFTIDGSSSKQSAGCTWALHASDGTCSNMSEIKPLASAAYQLPAGTTAIDAELIVLKAGLSFMQTVAVGRRDL